MLNSTVRTLSLCLFAFFSLAVASCSKNDDPSRSYFHRYEADHGHVRFEYAGDRRGGEDLYWTNHGNREVRISKYLTVTPGGFRPVDELTILDNGTAYYVQKQKNVALHSKDAEIDSLMQLSKEETPSPSAFADAKMKDLFFTKSGTDTLLGLNLDVYQMTQIPIKLYLWKGLLLKRTVTDPEHRSSLTAISFDTVSAVDTNLFHLPPGVEVKENPSSGKHGSPF